MILQNYFSLKITFIMTVLMFNGLTYGQKLQDAIAAENLYQKADSLLLHHKYQNSIDNFEKALFIYKKLEKWEIVADCYNKISENQWRNVVLKEALQSAEKALEISTTKLTKNNLQEARAHDNIGTYYRLNGADFDKMFKHHNKALEIRSIIFPEEHKEFAISYFELGLIYHLKGNYDKALNLYNKALTIQKKNSKEEGIEIANIYESIGMVLYNTGKYDESLLYFEKLHSIASKTYDNNNFYFVKVFNKIGIIYYYKGELNNSLEYYKRALDISIYNLGNDHADQARLHHNLSTIYYEIDEEDKALFHAEKTIEIGIKTFGGNYRDLFYPYSFVGQIYKGEKGIHYIKKALAICLNSFGKNHIRTSEVYSSLAKLYQDIGKYDIALNYLNQSLDIHLELFGENNANVVYSYNLLAKLFLEKKEYNKTVFYADKAITANKQFRKNDVLGKEEFDSCLSLTRLLTSLEKKAFSLKMIYHKNKDEASLNNSIETYEKASRLIEIIRRSRYNKDDKVTLAQDVKNVFGGSVETQILRYRNERSCKSIEKAFYYSERSKANILKEFVNDANAKGYSGLPSELLLLEKELKEKLALTKSNLIANIKEGDVSEGEILDISRKQDSLKRILEKRYPKYYQMKYEDTSISTYEIQDKLPETTTLVEYFMTDTTIYAFVINKSAIEVAELSVPNIEQKIQDFRNSIVLKDNNKFIALSSLLFQELISPILDKFQGDQLIILPDEVLWNLNFDLLLTSSKNPTDIDDLPYLLKKYAISYANSAELLFNKRNSDIKDHVLKECLAFSFTNSDSLSVGNVLTMETLRDSDEDLPGTRQEIKAIADIVKGRYFFGSEAIEKNFKMNSSKYSIIHLAMHGEVDNENPENSKIYFTKIKDSIDDNFLYAHELYALDIPAELTVLSACNTGVGKIAKGEGVLSLGMAFQYAGSESLLLSSWEISDQTTPRIMKSFYSNLSEGMNKPKALQKAKLSYLSSASEFEKYPVYWAGFYLIGDIAPIEFESPKDTKWFLYIVIAVILALSVGKLIYSNKNN